MVIRNVCDRDEVESYNSVCGDMLNQYLRALKAMNSEHSRSFVTYMIEMNLDPKTVFECTNQTALICHISMKC